MSANRVILDGKDAAGRVEWVNRDFEGGPVLAVVTLDSALTYGAFIHVGIETRQGLRCMAQVRVRDDFFPIMILGNSSTPAEWARRYFNTAYEMNSVDRPTDDLAAAGMKFVGPARTVADVAKHRDDQGRIGYSNIDEPDAADFSSGEFLPPLKRTGVTIMNGALGRHEIYESVEGMMRVQRENDPQNLTMVLADCTSRPINHAVYGELADITLVDPYFPYFGAQIDDIFHTLDIAAQDCAPRPLVPVLWALVEGGNRAPTPVEENLMVHFAMGTGAKGVAYYLDWFAPQFYGQIGLSRVKPLWEEVTRLNAQITRLAPLLAIGHPFQIASGSHPKLWVRSLLCGRDTFVVVAVNNNHQIGGTGGKINKYPWHFPMKNEQLRLKLPPWFKAAALLEIHDGNVAARTYGTKHGEIILDLPELESSTVFVVSSDKRIADRLGVLKGMEVPARLTPERWKDLKECPIPPQPADAAIAIRNGVSLPLREQTNGICEFTLDFGGGHGIEQAFLVQREDAKLCAAEGGLGLFPQFGKPGWTRLYYRLHRPVPLVEAKVEADCNVVNQDYMAYAEVGVSLAAQPCTNKPWLVWAKAASTGAWPREKTLSVETKSEGSTNVYVSIMLWDPGIVSINEPACILKGIRVRGVSAR